MYVQIAIILTLVTLAGYITLYLYSTSSGDKGFRLTSDACHEMEGVCRASCSGNEVPKTKCGEGMACCVEVFPSSPEDRIYYKGAEDGKDIGQCNRIIDDEMRASCKLEIMDMLNHDFALRYMDRKYCILIGDEGKREGCMAALAKEAYDISLCSEIDALGPRYKCIGAIAAARGDGMICMEIPPEIEQGICLKEIALLKSEIAICGQIAMPTEAADCRLKVELIRLRKGYVNCVKLPESACLQAGGCRAAYFTPECDGCNGKRFEICLPDNDRFCEDTLGEWDVLEEECGCRGKAWFDGFGCYGCDAFKESSSIMECERRLAAT